MDNDNTDAGRKKRVHSTGPKKKPHTKTLRRAEEIDLTEEDERVLTQVWENIGRENRARLDRYQPLMDKLVSHLQILDAEAVPLPSGTPMGLLWYAHHRRRTEVNPKKCRNEEDWSRRIKSLLLAEGIHAIAEQRYPTPPRRRCDLVIQWPVLGETWIEVKGAWRHSDARGRVKNGAYKKHLVAAGRDLKKLTTLDGSAAEHIALLLVGFDTDVDPIEDDDLKLVEAGAVHGNWLKQYKTWPDPYRPGGRIHIWLWIKEAHYVPDIFDECRPD